MTDIPSFITSRRSIRAFAPPLVETALLDTCIEAACTAPAPHHARPWRWVTITSDDAKRTLAAAMGASWRADLTGDGVEPARIETLLATSAERLQAAPALVLGCLTDDGLDHYPDATRQAAEHGMALLSLGAAVENLMLAANHLGLATCWVAAPIFCPDAARQALALDPTWQPQALICVGYPDTDAPSRERPTIDLKRFIVRR